MRPSLGIRQENKYPLECRAPITPAGVRTLVERDGLSVTVEASGQRIFSDRDYQEAGARIEENLSVCPVIFGVKEIPTAAFEPGKTYLFFSHVTKGQSYNMPMLKRMMELECNHIDYEHIVDDQNRRLVFFGRYAGLAGMINTLWSAGERFRRAGISTPFSEIRQCRHYASLDEAKAAVAAAGQRMAEEGLPGELCPFTLGCTGYGNVSKGAQEIANLLPVEWVAPEELRCLPAGNGAHRRTLFATVFEERHLVTRTDSAPFALQEYYEHPQAYRADFERFLPHLTLLVNGMYWDERYPRIVTREAIRNLFRDGPAKLAVIGDITCDPGGSIEITHRSTTIEDPVYVVDPVTQESRSGFEGKGVLVMAVDILPSELPRDASGSFSDALLPFVKPLAEADFGKPVGHIGLPPPLQKALILHRGKLTPEYAHLEKYLSGSVPAGTG